MTPITNADFANLANPHSWVVCGDNLFEQSVSLHRRKGQAYVALRQESSVYLRWDAVDKSMFLLAGFALENIIKAYLVYEFPHFVADGKLHRKLRSHDLVYLKNLSTIIPQPVRSEPILRTFSEGIDSWSRYPCALTAQRTTQQRWFTPELWERYTALMRRYGVHLKGVLSRPWNGPHGQVSSIEFSAHPILDADYD